MRAHPHCSHTGTARLPTAAAISPRACAPPYSRRRQRRPGQLPAPRQLAPPVYHSSRAAPFPPRAGGSAYPAGRRGVVLTGGVRPSTVEH